MPFLRLSSMRIPLRRSTPSIRFIGVPRSFQSCRILAVGKESKVHEEGRGEQVEAEIKEQLKKAKTGDNQWEENLASDSEESVKADRGELSNSNESIQELQQESAKLAEKEKREGKYED